MTRGRTGKSNTLYNVLAETPGVAWDYIRNEGTRKINLVLYKNNYNLQRFKPPRKIPGTQ
jgi:hypothetical protein